MNVKAKCPMPALPLIRTDRFILRPLEDKDAEPYHAVETDREVKRFLGGASEHDVERYRTMIRQKESWPGAATTLAATLRQDGSFLGRCGFLEYYEGERKIGWQIQIVLGRQCPRRKGYATEIGRALMNCGFEKLETDVIFGIFQVADEQGANEASEGLCKKLEFEYMRDTTWNGNAAKVYARQKQPSKHSGIKGWRKWLIAGVAAFCGAILQDIFYPPGRMHIATHIGALLGAAFPPFALGGLFAIPFRGKIGAVIGVVAVVVVWGLIFLGRSVSR
jgi:[ribosomal protein S5]-alanine N-acetyltransferase